MRFIQLTCSLALLAVAFTLGPAGPARASTLVYEANFTATLTSWFVGPIHVAYDVHTGDDVAFDPRDYSTEELGILGGRDLGDQWAGSVSVWESQSGHLSVTCVGVLGRGCSSAPGYAAVQVELNGLDLSIEASGVSFMSGLVLGPKGGGYGYVDDSAPGGVTDGVSWMALFGGLSFGLTLSEVQITTPSPVPLPAGGLLLVAALGLLARVRRGLRA